MPRDRVSRENADLDRKEKPLYEESFKQHVVDEVKKRRHTDSVEKIAKEFDVAPRTLYSWCYKYGVFEKRATPLASEPPPPKVDNHIDDTSIQKRNRELEQEVESQRRVIAILVEALRKSTDP